MAVLSTYPDIADPFAQGSHSGLNFAYGDGAVRDDNTVTGVSASTVALTDATTNYVEVTGAGTVSKNTSGFTAGSIPLYTAVTSGGAITTVTDKRAFLLVPGSGGGSVTASQAFGGGGGNYTTTSSTFADIDATNLSINIAAAENDVLDLYFETQCFHSSTTGQIRIAFAIAGSSIAVPTPGAMKTLAHGSSASDFFNCKQLHTVQAGDISGGTVQVRPQFATNTGTLTLRNDTTNGESLLIVKNLGQ